MAQLQSRVSGTDVGGPPPPPSSCSSSASSSPSEEDLEEVLRRLPTDEERFTCAAIRILERDQQAVNAAFATAHGPGRADAAAAAFVEDDLRVRPAASTQALQEVATRVRWFQQRCERFEEATGHSKLDRADVGRQAALALFELKKKQRHFQLQLAKLELRGASWETQQKTATGTTAAGETGENAELKFEHDATKALLECKGILEQQIEQVDEASSTLSADSQALGRTRSTYIQHKQKLKHAAELLRQIKEKERVDNLIFYGGLSFFFIVVAYVLTKRTGVLWLATKFVQNLLAMVGFGGDGDVDRDSGALISEATALGGLPQQLGDILVPDTSDNGAEAMGEIALQPAGLVTPGESGDDVSTGVGNKPPQNFGSHGIQHVEEATADEAAHCAQDDKCPSGEASDDAAVVDLHSP